MTIAVLDSSNGLFYLLEVPDGTDIEERLFDEDIFKESEISWMVVSPLQVLQEAATYISEKGLK